MIPKVDIMGKELYDSIINYKYTEQEEKAAKQITEYVEKKYNVKVFKCMFFSRKQDESGFVEVYLNSNKEYKDIVIPDRKSGRLYIPEDGKEINKILNKNNIDVIKGLDEGYNLMFSSFQKVAMGVSYSLAFKEFRSFKAKYFNSETMKSIDSSAMFVVYKTKELMEKAQKNGELAKIKEEYYNFIKKYDEFNYITHDKHLLVHFDYAENARSPREYSELYWHMLGAE